MALLFIVARHRPEHVELLNREFSHEVETGDLRIIMDRRHGERREHLQTSNDERRREDRRRRWEVDESVRTLGWAIAQAA